jgi:fumarate hydratase class II
MPGKVNPVMCEVVTQVAAQVIGNDAAVSIGAQGGRLELNVMVPLVAHNVLQSVDILASAMRLFAERCVDGLEADADRCRELAERSPSLATALAPLLGYDRAARLARESMRTGRRLEDLALEQGLLTRDQAEQVFDLRRMTEPGAPAS